MDTLFVINPAFSTGQLVATRGVYDLACQNPDFAKFIQESLPLHKALTVERQGLCPR